MNVIRCLGVKSNLIEYRQFPHSFWAMDTSFIGMKGCYIPVNRVPEIIIDYLENSQISRANKE